MKKLRNYIWLLLLGILFVQCENRQEDSPKDSVPQLQAKLERDSLYTNYNSAFEKQLRFAIANKDAGHAFNNQTFQEGIKDVHSREDYIKLCEKSGIKNAKEALIRHSQFLKAQDALFRKYPQIASMSREERAALFEKSDQKIASTLRPVPKIMNPLP